jgi:predicted amidohydrolase YtcJ
MAARLTTYLVVAIVAATLVAGLMVGAQRDDSSGPVDLIVHNAKVYAADDTGSILDAVAIRGNKILHVGSEREIMRYKRPQTTVIDARGAALLPGFIDAHVSFIAGGLAAESVQLFDASSLDEIQDRVTAWADAHPHADWILGHGWSGDTLSDQPTRAALDAAVSDRPVALRSDDGRALWVNTKAIELAGITRRTPSPKNGTIVRDRRGEATGLLEDDAIALIDRVLPAPTKEERARALRIAIQTARQHGITSVQDFGVTADDLAVYDAARKEGTLGVRVYLGAPATSTGPLDAATMARRYPDDPLLKSGLARIVLDGSLTPRQLMELVDTLDTAKQQIAIEVRGEGGVREALDAYEALSRRHSDASPSRHRVEDIESIDTDDAARFRALHVIASLQPLRALSFDLPSTLDSSGARVAFGSDWPNRPLDPVSAIAAAVTHTAAPADGAIGRRSEQLALKSAINAWTSGAAWASFDELRKGRVKPGMLADLVVLSNDIFGSRARLSSAQVAMTIFDGKVVYRRAAS